MRITILFTILRDFAPDIFTVDEAKEVWDRYGPEDRVLTWRQVRAGLSALRRNGLVVEIPRRRLFYVVRASEYEAWRNRVDAGR